jgi:NHLM bacteriocin system ABC transporter peptidase/ATP-binding protein
MEAVECGAAALGIVLEYHGRIVPLAVLRRDCGVSRDGSKASNIVRAARGYGLVAKGFKKELAALRDVAGPAILFWNFNHFVVLEGFEGERAWINDPVSGRRSVSPEELDESFTGVVLILEPGPEFKRGGERLPVRGLLTQALGRSKLALLYCVLAGFCLVGPGLAFPIFTQLFVDHVLIEGNHAWLGPILLAMGVTALIEGFLVILRQRHLRDLRVKIATGMSSRFLWHVLRLPVDFFTQRFSGEVAGRLSLNDSIAAVLSGQLAQTVIDCVMLVFFVGLMLLYDPVLTLVGVAAAMINVLALRFAARLRKVANLRILQEEGKLGGVAVAGLQSIETLKASALESRFFVRWSGHYAKAVNVRQELALADQVLWLVPGLLSALVSVLVLVVGGLRVMDGALSIGMLIAFMSLLGRFQAPVTTLVGMAASLQTMSGDLGRLQDVLSHPTDPLTHARGGGAPSDSATLAGYVEMKSVSFGYNPTEAPLIKDFSLSLEPGRRLALVGASGSGKSTLARILAGLLQPTAGEVRYDGRLLKEIPRQVLANSLSLVEQDLVFFAGTMRDNLTLWDESIDDATLERAARDAEIHQAISSMAGGYGSELEEGAANVSGGEKQRLEIARALVRNPSVLILDEATANLDAETERKIDRNLRVRGCTCVVVAHRLSTIRTCDEIVVLKHGVVVQRGTYDELEGKGEFARLLGVGTE